MEGSILNSKVELGKQIEVLKEVMIKTGLKAGFNHELTVSISQDLDVLIYEFQRMSA